MEHPSRYSIGIDLGTTNSVLAYIDAATPDARSAHVLSIPQIAAPGDVLALTELPSFLYFPTEHDSASGSLALPWNTEPPAFLTGVMAREQGALAPGRQVASAKSWLGQSAVDRRAKILPRQAQASEPKLSPVEASAAYLTHLRDAWNFEMASSGEALLRCESQDIVLTVPASFDEEARELTVEAAHTAGLHRLTLLEEPLAAFYAWLARPHDSENELREGDVVLVCDIGGGTTDFTLIRVGRSGDEVTFERTAIGEHLLLGGDNLDIALARKVMDKLAGHRLGLRQLQILQRKCSSAKEQLMAEAGPERVPIALPGTGRSLTGGIVATELLREEVEAALAEGFLPLTEKSQSPRRQRRAGLKELGLSYAEDPAITRHLSNFLSQAALAMEDKQNRMIRPDAILFNGGFCTPTFVRKKIVELISEWFSGQGRWQPRVLNDEVTASPVAVGAAHYGMVQRGVAKRVRAGSARSYYIGVRADHGAEGVCVLPAGVDEGTTLPQTNRDFAVIANRPVSFALFSSRTRRDAHGEVVTLNEEEMHRHAPLVTMLRYGKKVRDVELAVRLRASFTETGTLEIWCESRETPHRWKLQFELRGDDARKGEMSRLASSAPVSGAPEELTVSGPQQLLRSVFLTRNPVTADTDAVTLVARLESALGANRDAWPLATARALCDTLVEVEEGRRRSFRHEVRWLNLFGFCLRPGFGAISDDRRIAHARRLQQGGLAFPSDVQCQVEWRVLWRRISGGLNASLQQELYRAELELLGLGGKKPKTRLNRQVEQEQWRMLASLEHLTAKQRTALGNQLVTKLVKEPLDGHWLWSLGRLGARIPLYGSLSCVVPTDTASSWLELLLKSPELTSATVFAIVQIAMRTDDRTRDVSEELRRRAIKVLSASGLETGVGQHLQQAFPLTRTEALQVFGESLPEGLPLASSLNCVIPVAALSSGWQKAV